MTLNEAGNLVSQAWQRIPVSFPHSQLDQWIVMPDHFHGILWFVEDNRKGEVAGNDDSPDDIATAPATSPLPSPSGRYPGSLGAIIQGFKSMTTRQVNALRVTPGVRVWQRNDFERVICNERELDRAREYIRHNPLQWQMDQSPGGDWWE